LKRQTDDATADAALQQLLDQIGEEQQSLHIPYGKYLLKQSHLIPANVTLVMQKGAIFELAAETELQIYGKVQAGIAPAFIGQGNQPTPLTEQEVAMLGVDRTQAVVDYEIGDSVRIMSGPLENFTGTVESINVEKAQVKVRVSMFGRDISAELEYSQIQRIF
jgi:hypothetical protein